MTPGERVVVAAAERWASQVEPLPTWSLSTLELWQCVEALRTERAGRPAVPANRPSWE